MLPSVWEDANDIMEQTFGNLPKVNMFEKDDSVHIEVEVVGYKPEVLDVSITGDVLKLPGTEKRKSKIKKQNITIFPSLLKNRLREPLRYLTRLKQINRRLSFIMAC